MIDIPFLLILRATLHFTDAGSEVPGDLPEVALSGRSRIEAHPGQSVSRSCALIASPHRRLLTHTQVPLIELLLVNVPFYLGKSKRCSLDTGAVTHRTDCLITAGRLGSGGEGS